jgi:hypothetical protein
MPSKNAEESLLDSILGNTDTAGQDDDTTEPQDGLDDTDDGQNQDLNDPDDHSEDDDDDDDEDGENEDDASDDDEDSLDTLERAAKEAASKNRPARQKQQQKSQDSPFDPNAKLQTDKKGAIYFNGQKVAEGGREARMFMEWRKVAQSERRSAIEANKQTVSIAQAAQEVLARYNELKGQKTAFDNAGLSPTEQSQMLELATAYKKNPIEGIKLMLTRAHLSGIDIKSVVGANGGFDAKALMDEMSAKMGEMLKPVITQTTQQTRADALRKEAESFFTRNGETAMQVAQLVGGSHKLALYLREAKAQSPDLSLDELFQRLHYAILTKFNGRLPTTGPVGRKPGKGRRQQVERRMNKNFQKHAGVQSFDDIAASVLADAKATEARGV